MSTLNPPEDYAYTAVRLQMSSGSIASGDFSLRAVH